MYPLSRTGKTLHFKMGTYPYVVSAVSENMAILAVFASITSWRHLGKLV